ncbi:amidohydrolase family protein [Rubrimonas cliftonensis]|uniref:Guanine deaminase n=1 Tax=Rubrimonas cliftonensis TaxID=89524 RepID=A0A1H4FMK8_9RHOB|nr:amidohydrolase family protein [Rubrimonas cliftonensis]SEA98589.1 guanine deaminase [Rubrimonas cliftonensis]
MTTSRTIVRGGLLLDIEARSWNAADILIEGDRIAEIGPPGMAAPEDARPLDAARRLMHPGLVNAHTHGHGGLSKGMGDLWTLELLLNAGPWVSGGRLLEDKYLSTFIGAVEMLMKGCTAAYDLSFEFPAPTPDGMQACASAYADAGMRAVVAPMVAEYSFYDAIPGLADAVPAELQPELARFRLAPAEACLAAMREILRDWRHDHDLIRPAIAPTIPHHCSDAFMLNCGRLAREFGLGLHSHVQESKVQVISAMRIYGKTQTAHLDALGLLGPDFTVAHGVWLDDDDMRRLGDRGASVAHNPGSNMRLGSGLADVRGMIRRGVNVGVGTDGANCSDNLNVYEVMRLASLVSKVQGPDTAAWLTTQEVALAATVGGARLMGMEGLIGRIAPGYKADIVFLDLDHPNWMPLNDAVNQLVHTEDGSAVRSVMVGGVLRVENGRPTGVDLPRLAQKVEAARARLEDATQDARRLGALLADTVNRHCPNLARHPYHIDRYGGCATR